MKTTTHKFRAVGMHGDQEITPVIHFTAMSVKAAKRHATVDLNIDQTAKWQESENTNEWIKQERDCTLVLTEITPDMYYALT